MELVSLQILGVTLGICSVLITLQLGLAIYRSMKTVGIVPPQYNIPFTNFVEWPPIPEAMHKNPSSIDTERVIDSGEFDITDFGSTLTESQLSIMDDIEDTLEEGK